jgi:hypothetical protein
MREERMRASHWNFLALVPLVTVAVVEGINETVKLDPAVLSSLPDFLRSTWWHAIWHYAPLTLVVFAAVTTLLRIRATVDAGSAVASSPPDLRQ